MPFFKNTSFYPGCVERQLTMQLLLTTTLFTIGGTFLLWIQSAFYFLGLLSVYRAPLQEWIYLMTLLLPDLIATTLPFSLFLAAFLQYSHFKKTNTYNMLRNAGCSSYFFCKPLIVCGLLGTSCLFYAYIHGVPASMARFKSAEHNLRNTLSVKHVRTNTLNHLGPFILFVEHKTHDERLKNVFIYDTREKDNTLSLTAQEAFLQKKEKTVALFLNHGLKQVCRKSNCQFIHFENYLLPLDHLAQKARSVRRLYEIPTSELLAGCWRKKPDKAFLKEMLRRIITPLYALAFCLLLATLFFYIPTQLSPLKEAIFGFAGLLILYFPPYYAIQKIISWGAVASFFIAFMIVTLPVLAFLFLHHKEHLMEKRYAVFVHT